MSEPVSPSTPNQGLHSRKFPATYYGTGEAELRAFADEASHNSNSKASHKSKVKTVLGLLLLLLVLFYIGYQKSWTASTSYGTVPTNLRGSAVSTMKNAASATISKEGVETAEISQEGVETAKISKEGVETAKISREAVETAEISQEGVETAEISKEGVVSTALQENKNADSFVQMKIEPFITVLMILWKIAKAARNFFYIG